MTRIKQIGQVIIISLIFMGVILLLTAALLGFVYQNVSATRRALWKEQAVQLADAGIDKAVWQLNLTAGAYTGESGTVLGTGEFDVTVTTLTATSKEISAIGYVPNKANPKVTREVKVEVSINTTTASFFYGVQVGNGGLVMNNNSRIVGNVYSNGTIDGAQGVVITGDAYSALAAGRIFDRLTINGNAHAHQIDSSSGKVTIGGNAYGNVFSDIIVTGNVFAYSISKCTITGNASYTTISSCTIGGSRTTPYPGEPDPPAEPFPITAAQINDWKTTAAAGGTITGNYTLTNFAQASLGPKKITGNLLLDNGAVLTLTGPIWVVGNITISNNAVVALDPLYVNNSEVMIADGVIDVVNNAIFQRAGPTSYILMTTTSPSDDAFDIANNADALIAYAPYGTIDVSNNVQVREVTGFRIRLANNAAVTYESGLANLSFTGGPGASWRVRRGTWREVK